MQTAYQVQAASSLELLSSGSPDLWDSGRVVSGETLVPYGGAVLASRQRAHWRVRYWDQRDELSPWSEPAWWAVGLLADGDWRADWICAPGEVQPGPDLVGCPWVWLPTGMEGDQPTFRKVLALDPTPTTAQLAIASFGPFELFVNGLRVASGTYWNTAYHVDLRPYLRAGDNEVLVKVKPAGTQGLAGRYRINDLGGQVDDTWLSAGEPDGTDWQAALVVGRFGEEPWGRPRLAGTPGPPPCLRRTFGLDGLPARATLYATALGLYEMRLNGEKVGNEELAPGWTDYGKRLQYQSHDVTGLLRLGENALGMVLADGWYAGNVSCVGREVYGTYPLRARAHLHLEYPDGSDGVVATDRHWRASSGEILYADLQCGEARDARREPRGWDAPGFDDSTWAPVSIAEAPEAALVPQVSPPVRVTRELAPVARQERPGGSVVYDFGQNLAGRARLTLRGEAGQAVQLRFAEVLAPDGSLYLENLRGAWQTDHYTLRGDEIEVFEPRFTVHGFRYMELRGDPSLPEVIAVIARVMHADMEESGSFTSSNPLLNRLHEVVRWTQRANSLSVPTDCPNRDERMGWLADGLNAFPASARNYDVAAFYEKWLDDIADSQYTDGEQPHVAPDVLHGGGGEAGWADAAVMLPWLHYQHYGDEGILEKHYENARRMVEHARRHSRGGLRPAEGFGDWLSDGEETPKDLVATAYLAESARLLSRMAGLPGRYSDRARYARLATRVRAAFRDAYLLPEGRMAADTQTAYVLALAFHLPPASQAPVLAARLAAKIRERGECLATGYLGIVHLLRVLSEHGEHELAYRLATSERYPSWGNMLTLGATTLWERWNGLGPDGPADPAMNSFNHPSLGSINEWFFRDLAGLDQEAPGFRRILFRPRPPRGLASAAASLEGRQGRIAIAWRQEAGRLEVDATVPPNSSARLVWPGPSEGISLNGRPAGRRTLQLAPGEHHLSGPLSEHASGGLEQ
jgi:alpha-L-rhamnosidase